MISQAAGYRGPMNSMSSISREHTRIGLRVLIIEPPQFHTCLCGDEQGDNLIVGFP
jgi:hypothetical protein